MTRDVHHDVTVRQEPTSDDEGNGMQAIIRAFIKNPVAACEIVGFVIMSCGIYYGLTTKVNDAQAASEQHYKDLSAEMTRAVERLGAKLDVLAASDASETADIKALFARGDQRWAAMGDKMTGIEVRFTKAEAKLDNVAEFIRSRPGTVRPNDAQR